MAEVIYETTTYVSTNREQRLRIVRDPWDDNPTMLKVQSCPIDEWMWECDPDVVAEVFSEYIALLKEGL